MAAKPVRHDAAHPYAALERARAILPERERRRQEVSKKVCWKPQKFGHHVLLNVLCGRWPMLSPKA
eukprot:5535594-Prymnesium_polylepis.1